MSYHTEFSVSYDLGKSYDEKAYNNAVTKALRANYEHIAKQGSTRQETQNDWFDFIVNQDGRYVSMAYENLDVLIEVGKQFIKDGLTDYVRVVFVWDGEESGDYSRNVYHIRAHENAFLLTKDKVISQVDEVEVDQTKSLERE